MIRHRDRFHQAARDGYLEIIKEASRREADSPDEDGMTPVLWAAFYGHLDALRLLISRGGVPDRCDLLGNTALHCAASNGHLHCVTFLVNFGANIWALDNDLHSALDLAAFREHSSIVQFLDTIGSHRMALNRRAVQKLKERAIVVANKRANLYRKIQVKTSQRAEKEVTRSSQKTLQLHQSSPQVAFRLKRNGNEKSANITVRIDDDADDMYDVLDSPNKSTSTLERSTAGKKAYSEHFQANRTGFKLFGTSASAIIRRVNRKKDCDTDVLYRPRRDSGNTLDQRGKALSESDLSLMDSSNETEEPNNIVAERHSMSSGGESGLFERPGFGSVSFFHKPSVSNSLMALPVGSDAQTSVEAAHEIDDNNKHVEKDSGLGTTPSRTLLRRRNSHTNESIGTLGSLLKRVDFCTKANEFEHGELPWSAEDVDSLDDDVPDKILSSSTSAFELFLAANQLTEVAQTMNREQLDLTSLALCTEEDLSRAGLALGPRRKIINAIERRQEQFKMPGPIIDSPL